MSFFKKGKADEPKSFVGSHLEKVVSKVEDKEIVGEDEVIREEVKAAMDDELGSMDWVADLPIEKRIAVQFCRIFTAMSSLYFFLVSLSLMGDSFQALTGKSAGGLFNGQDSPIVGLMVGIIATVLVQSSSTTTSIIVVLVGQNIIEVQTAVPMIMGANIGTSVTSTIVSLGFADDKEAYRRGFAGATVHDMFNYLNVAVMLPLELFVSAVFNNGNGGLLQIVAEALSEARGDSELEGGDDFKDANPIKKITNPILDFLISVNKDVINDYAKGFPEVPEDELNCTSTFLFHDENTNADKFGCFDFLCDFCPEGVFNESLFITAEEAFDNEKLIDGGVVEGLGDTGGGILTLILSLVILIVSLGMIVKMLSALVQGAAQKVLVKSLNHNYPGGQYVSILIGCAITFIVQSSSITTSILTPLVAIDALSLENMFPFTLGANIGTTGTGLIAAAAAGEQAGYTIALVHFFFNVFGTLVWFPIPRIREIPLNAARSLGELASIWKAVPVIYIFLAFILYPLVFFGFSEGFRSGHGGSVAVAVIFFIIFMVAHLYAFFWYKKKGGKEKFISYIAKRQEREDAKKALKDKEGEADI